MESVKDKYSRHQIPSERLDKIHNHKELYRNMENAIDAMDRSERKIIRKLIKNDLLSEVQFFAGDVFSVPNRDLLELREDYYNQLIGLIEENINMISRMMSFLSQDNFMEIFRLFDFMVDQYAMHYRMLSSKLDGLEFAKKGIEYLDCRYPDTRDETSAFFQKK